MYPECECFCGCKSRVEPLFQCCDTFFCQECFNDHAEEDYHEWEEDDGTD